MEELLYENINPIIAIQIFIHNNAYLLRVFCGESFTSIFRSDSYNILHDIVNKIHKNAEHVDEFNNYEDFITWAQNN